MGKLFRGLLGTVTLFSLPILLLHIRPTAKNSNKSPTTANSTVNSTTSEDIRPNNPLVDSPNISFASSQIREQRWKKRQTLQTCLCYFSQLVLIFRPGARKTMREECYTHCIISTRAISTSAISINNAFFMLFTDFS